MSDHELPQSDSHPQRVSHAEDASTPEEILVERSEESSIDDQFDEMICLWKAQHTSTHTSPAQAPAITSKAASRWQKWATPLVVACSLMIAVSYQRLWRASDATPVVAQQSPSPALNVETVPALPQLASLMNWQSEVSAVPEPMEQAVDAERESTFSIVMNQVDQTKSLVPEVSVYVDHQVDTVRSTLAAALELIDKAEIPQSS